MSRNVFKNLTIVTKFVKIYKICNKFKTCNILIIIVFKHIIILYLTITKHIFDMFFLQDVTQHVSKFGIRYIICQIYNNSD